MGVTAGIIGTLQATEALKILLETGIPLVGRLMFYDAMKAKLSEIKIKRNPDCPVCGHNSS